MWCKKKSKCRTLFFCQFFKIVSPPCEKSPKNEASSEKALKNELCSVRRGRFFFSPTIYDLISHTNSPCCLADTLFLSVSGCYHKIMWEVSRENVKFVRQLYDTEPFAVAELSCQRVKMIMLEWNYPIRRPLWLSMAAKPSCSLFFSPSGAKSY